MRRAADGALTVNEGGFRQGMTSAKTFGRTTLGPQHSGSQKKPSCPVRLTALNLAVSAVPARDYLEDAAIENA